MIVRGFSFIIAHYPDEGFLHEMIIHNEFRQADRYLFQGGYIYFAFIFFFYLIFFIINLNILKKIEKEFKKENIEDSCIFKIDEDISKENIIKTIKT